MTRRRVALVLGVAGLGGVAAAAVLLWPVVACHGAACPSLTALQHYEPPQASRVFAGDGSLLADLSPQRRIVVDLKQISPLLRDGVVAVEDRRFWSHHGVDGIGIGRAALHDLASLSFREGFSTLDMQLARSIFPDALPLSDKLRRKAWEVLLAWRMEGRLTKAEILGLYLNQIYLGSGLYGVEAASEGYFGRHANELEPAQAALLVALIKTPERYNPRRDSPRALARRNLVLGIWQRAGLLSAAEARRAEAEPIRLAPPYETAGSAPYFVAAVRSELRDLFGHDADVRGLRVYTGLDPELQGAARKALLGQIGRIEEGRYGRFARPKSGAGADSAAVLQGMVIALDPATGLVRALVGGRDFQRSQYDRALQARRQPGSAFKPIVYAAALEQGLPPTARVSTQAVSVVNAGSPTWRPGDHLADSVDALPVRRALAVSSNRAAVRVGEWAGQDRVVAMARSLGLTTPIPPYPSMFLGAAEVVPAELVAAFAAFGNGGWRVRPRLIDRVEDTEGHVLWRAADRRERALDEGTAFITLSLLEDVVDEGTGAGVRNAGFWLPAAGKTGTTNDSRDAWFIGLTPDLVAGVWLGFDEPRTIVRGGSGGSLAAPVWTDLMKAAYRDRPAPAPWVPPPSVISAEVDEVSGELATANCPPDQVRVEYFLPGTEPTEYCPLHPDGGARFLERLWRRMRRIF